MQEPEDIKDTIPVKVDIIEEACNIDVWRAQLKFVRATFLFSQLFPPLSHVTCQCFMSRRQAVQKIIKSMLCFFSNEGYYRNTLRSIGNPGQGLLFYSFRFIGFCFN